jgi:hypothetical protein
MREYEVGSRVVSLLPGTAVSPYFSSNSRRLRAGNRFLRRGSGSD